MASQFNTGQGQLYGSLPCYTQKQPTNWQTCRSANYRVISRDAPINYKTIVPFDRNYGRSDWYQRGYPYNLQQVDIVDDTSDARAASFAVDYCPSDYQYLEYADDFADRMCATQPDTRKHNERNHM